MVVPAGVAATPENNWLNTVDAFASGDRGSVALAQDVVPLYVAG